MFHWGCVFVAFLLGQALSAAHLGYDLEMVLGPNLHLLLWMPKAAGAGAIEGTRPLQLRTCFRRLFGAALAGELGSPERALHLRLSANRTLGRATHGTDEYRVRSWQAARNHGIAM